MKSWKRRVKKAEKKCKSKSTSVGVVWNCTEEQLEEAKKKYDILLVVSW